MNTERVTQLTTRQRWTRDELAAGRAIACDLLPLETTSIRSELERHPEWQRMGVLQHLVDVANAEHDRHPQRAYDLTALVMEFADRVPPAPSAVRWLIFQADVRREYTHALRAAGETTRALSVIRDAVKLLERNPACAFPLAVARLVEAQVLHTRDESAAARFLVRQSAAVFLRYNDQPLYLDARLIEGTIYFQAREFERAQRVFRAVYDYAARGNLEYVLARSANNLAHTALELRTLAAAEWHFAEAERRFRELEMRAELSRVRWGRARIALYAGRLEEALAALRRARAEFQGDGVILEAATVTLDIAYALVQQGNPAAARTECDGIMAVFTAAHQYVHVHDALAYLLNTPDVEVERIAEVRTFLTRLEAEPTRRFIAA